jgi:2',3'-cyclic-nucleotide 2'-phosphodiesterase/3'-nucleotidase
MPLSAARLPSFLLLVLAALAAPLGRAERVQVTLLSTTDLHGNLFPVDYGRDRPAELGLAKVATLIRDIRREVPDAVLLDCGDTIQGTPLAYHHARLLNDPVDPMMLAMNALGFVSMTIGNHEFNFGLPVLQKARREAVFPWLSANTLRDGTEEPAFPAFLIRTVRGVRVGILGITTPGIPNWETPPHYAGLSFADPVASARRWTAHLRDEQGVDLVVAAVHMGIEENLATGAPTPGQLPSENAALAIARQVPGVDVIFMGHTHRSVPSLMVGDVLLAQAGRWGDRLARVDVYLDRPEASARWRVAAKSAVALPVTAATAADPEILALARPYHERTQAWLATPIGRSARELSASDSRLRDAAIVDLIHRVQLDAGRADVSFAASFTLDARVPAGQVTVRDIAGLYVYENTLVVVELTGAQVREALEHAARYFRPYSPGKSAAELVDPTIPGYNFDLAEGVEYVIDLRRAPGDRIVDLRLGGAPLDPARKLRVAINNYRHNGGGGYTMFRGAPVLQRSSEEIRNLIIQWVTRQGEIPQEPTNNWTLRL